VGASVATISLLLQQRLRDHARGYGPRIGGSVGASEAGRPRAEASYLGVAACPGAILSMPMLAVTKIICDHGDLIEGSAVGRASFDAPRTVGADEGGPARTVLLLCSRKMDQARQEDHLRQCWPDIQRGRSGEIRADRPFRQYGVLDSP
jgi:hypothetical protein